MSCTVENRLWRPSARLAVAVVASFFTAMSAAAGQKADNNLSSYLATTPALFGDMGGLRPWLGRRGASLSINETSEVLGNTSGGVRRGFDYDGVTTATLKVDTAKAVGIPGGTFLASALWIHGRNLSADNLGPILQTASGIEASRDLRLWELWYDQKLGSKADVKIGEQSLDNEWMVSTNALLFVNTMLGWAMVPSADMPAGGPAYPMAALGARLAVHPAANITVMAGLYNGRTMPDRWAANAQIDNFSGLAFPIGGGPLAIAEVRYSLPAGLLPGTYRLGAWYDGQQFQDLRDGALRRGDYSVYGIVDQQVWRQPGHAARALSLFARAMSAPLNDRNPVDFGLNAGATLKDPLPGRPDDTAGLAFGLARVSLDTGTMTAGHSETMIEATYQAQVTPWWQVQPDLQYIFHPGAQGATPAVGNEMIVGVRTNVAF